MPQVRNKTFRKQYGKDDRKKKEIAVTYIDFINFYVYIYFIFR